MFDTSTLIHYQLAEDVVAFSTTRHAPYPVEHPWPKDDATFAEFSLTHYNGDQPLRVQRARQWLTHQLDVPDEALIIPHQTHSSCIRCVDASYQGLSASDKAKFLEGVDGLITSCSGLCVGVSTADCVPVLLYDPQHQVVAAIHAGWRGTVAKITSRAVEMMSHYYGSSPGGLHAVIGPSIGVEAYEVGEEVVMAFLQAGFPQSVVEPAAVHPAAPLTKGSPSIHNQRPHLDLWAANRYLLLEAGLSPTNVHLSGICTYTHHRHFFSARRLGIHSGRIYTGIMLR